MTTPSKIANKLTAKKILHNFEIRKNVPIDKRFLAADMTTIDTDIPLNVRYDGLLFFGFTNIGTVLIPEFTGTFYYFAGDLLTPKKLIDFISDITITQYIVKQETIDATGYATLLDELALLQIKAGSIVHIKPLDIVIVYTGIEWKYLHGNFVTNNETLFLTVPLTLRKPGELAIVNGIEKIILSTGVLSNRIITVTDLPVSPNIEHNRYYLYKGFLYFGFSDGIYKLGSKTTTQNISLVVGDNPIAHNLNSANILCLFRINNNNGNIDIINGKTMILDYNFVDDNNIIIKSGIPITGQLLINTN